MKRETVDSMKFSRPMWPAFVSRDPQCPGMDSALPRRRWCGDDWEGNVATTILDLKIVDVLQCNPKREISETIFDWQFRHPSTFAR